MNSIGLSMNSCGKMSATPAVSGCRLRLSNFFLEEILRFAEQILGFLRWHTPKILRSSRHPLPAPCLTFFKRNQVYLLIPFAVLLLYNTPTRKGCSMQSFLPRGFYMDGAINDGKV